MLDNNRASVIEMLKETASYLKSASAEAYWREIKDIDEMIQRIENEKLDLVSVPRLISHLIIFAKVKI